MQGPPTYLETDGRPALLHLPHPERSRYVPQYDEQLLGQDEIFKIVKDYNNLPDPATSDTLRYRHCEACETT